MDEMSGIIDLDFPNPKFSARVTDPVCFVHSNFVTSGKSNPHRPSVVMICNDGVRYTRLLTTVKLVNYGVM